jgi:hypothetical protein
METHKGKIMPEIETMDQAIDYAMEIIGSDFEKSLMLCNSILENPSNYTGAQAGVAAMKLSIYRYQIGVAAQHWKIEAASTKKLSDRLIKDSLMVAYNALEEVVNTLKLNARQDIALAGTR